MSNNLRVGLDAHMVGGHETGNETYVRGLVEGFQALDDHLDLVVFNVGTAWTEPRSNVTFRRLTTANPYVRLGVELPARSVSERLDVMHVTYAMPLLSAAPVVVTIHDICYTTNPEWFSQRDLRVLSVVVPRSIRRAAHIITASEEARQQVIAHYAVPEARITAIHIGPGSGAEPITIEAARKELTALGIDPTRPYILAVGNLQPRKNLVRLFDAVNELVRRGRDLDLVVVGPQHYRADDIVKAAGPIADRVRFTGYVTDRQLAACYKAASVFVLPSLYEGFGLPALEAMAHGIPVACSNAGSLPEACGDAALLFDPHSTPAIVETIDRILGDPALRRTLSEAGIARAAEFSWKTTAEKTLEIYRRAAGR